MARPGHIVLVVSLALLSIGLVMVQSAGMRVSSGNDGELLGQFLGLSLTRNLAYSIVAIVGMLVASYIDLRQIMRIRGLWNPSLLLVIAAMVLVGLTLIPGFGVSVHGSSRWLRLGPRQLGLSFQPSEVLKWVMILAVAWWCSRRRGVMNQFFEGLGPILVLLAFACGLVVIEDLGTALLIALVAMCLLIAGGARIWQLLLLFPLGAVTVASAIMTSPYRRDRLLAFLNPWNDAQGIGYHPIQSMLTIAMGQIYGRGLGNGLQKLGYLPEDTTDFIFAVICEELGLVGALVVILLYLTLLWVGLGIVKNCKDNFCKLVGLGVLLTIGFQAIINLAVVTVVVPTKGIALPLISSGGTGWVLTAIALGLLISLDRMNAQEEQLALASPNEIVNPQLENGSQPALEVAGA